MGVWTRNTDLRRETKIRLYSSCVSQVSKSNWCSSIFREVWTERYKKGIPIRQVVGDTRSSKHCALLLQQARYATLWMWCRAGRPSDTTQTARWSCSTWTDRRELEGELSRASLGSPSAGDGGGPDLNQTDQGSLQWPFPLMTSRVWKSIVRLLVS